MSNILNPDVYAFRKLRGGQMVSDMVDTATTDQPQSAQQSQAAGNGAFKGFQAAADPANPLLWIVLALLVLVGLIGISFHIRVGRRELSASVG